MITDPSGRAPGLRASGVQFVGLLILLVAANIPYWNKTLWPNYDTITVFQIFYAFYNNWFLHGEFTRWLPYGNCGIQADYWQLFNLTPAAYFTGLLGGIFRVKNVLWLFKFSVLLEQGMMLYGMFLLCGKLFRHASARFFACLALILSTVWLLQVYWNFRIYYLLPLMLFLLLRWLETSRLRDLCLAGMVGVFSLVGNVAYFGALYALLLCIFVVTSFLCVRPDWRAMLRLRRQDALGLLLLLALAGLYVYFAAHMLDQIHSCPQSRDPGSSRVPLKPFLTDGSGLGLWKFHELVFPLPGRDYTFYLGFLPLAFTGYALVRSHQGRFAMFLVPALYLSLLSAGERLPVATWTYWFFPPMRWFHYIGQVAGLLRFFFIACAGFGLDQFLDDMERKPAGAGIRSCRILFLVLTVLLVVLGCWCHSIYKPMLSLLPWRRIYPVLLVLSVGSGLALAVLPAKFRRGAGLLATVFLALDLGVFQYHVIQGWPCRWAFLDPSAARVRPYSYQSQRSAAPDSGTEADHAGRAVESHPTQRCAIEAYQFMQFDPGWQCKRYLNIMWGEGVNRLLETRGKLTAQWNNDTLQYVVKLPELETPAMGWQAPKLRLVTEAAYAPDAETARRLVEKADIHHAPVLETDPPGSGGPAPAAAPEQDAGQLEVVAYTYNQLQAKVRVAHPRGAWLYYADAYHPGWKATVNGLPAPVVRANVAFKAVWLNAGDNQVRLVYSDGWRGWASAALAWSSLLFAAYLVVSMLQITWRDFGGNVRGE